MTPSPLPDAARGAAKASDLVKQGSVLVLLGTDHHPFNRLVDWVDRWFESALPGSECFIQYGHSRAPRSAAGTSYLAHEDLQLAMLRSDAVVCHGGPASILEARRAGHLPVCVARDASRG
ncbi:MAG: hypothetical protein ACYDBS_11045, partial [Acidimicrobiales bacterium]